MVKHAPANSGKPGPAGAGDGFRRIVSIVCGLALGAWASTGQAWVPLANVTGIAAGDAHTCASTSDGGISIKCWGNNDYGQIGDGTTTTRFTPVDVQRSSGFTLLGELSAGRAHTCAIASRTPLPFTVVPACWGANNRGQLGDGSTASRSIPGLVQSASRIDGLAAGGDHGCALSNIAAGFSCWGWNHYGQLGDGSTTTRLAPVKVSGITVSPNFGSQFAGRNHTCALFRELSLASHLGCWGANNTGQLGDGTTTNRLTWAEVSGISAAEVTSIAAGALHTCALTEAGAVKCWGYNRFGGLGDGTTTARLTPVDVIGLGSGVVGIAAGNEHTCALMSGGGVKCWGLNNSGQLGDGTTTDRSTPVDVISLSSGVKAISAGDIHTCALTTTGGVKCWGGNSSGQLGDGTVNVRRVPVDVLVAPIGIASIGSSANPSAFGTPVTFVANVASPGGTPTGAVTFRDGATKLDTVRLIDGAASYSSSALVGGTHSITAEYSGDGDYAGSISSALAQVVVVPGATGSITATPSPCDLSAAGTCSTTVTWSSTGTPAASVYVKAGGEPPVLFAQATSGAAAAPWITIWGATFELHAGILASDPVLASVVVRGALDSESASSAMGTITTTPNPCVLSAAGTCNAKVSWTTSGTPTASLYVRADNRRPSLFAEGTSGSFDAPWITAWGDAFELHAGPSATDPLLATAVVTGVLPGSSPLPTGTITATPNPCVLSAAGTCSATVTWATSGVATAGVYVRDGDGPPVLFAPSTGGTATAPWITKSGMTFELHAGTSASDPLLASVVVKGVGSTSPTGTITAEPNPCALFLDMAYCSTTVTWNASGTTAASVYVRDGSGAPVLFALSTSGAAAAPWIGKSVMTFDLHAGPSANDPLLASVAVTGSRSVPAGTQVRAATRHPR